VPMGERRNQRRVRTPVMMEISPARRPRGAEPEEGPSCLVTADRRAEADMISRGVCELARRGRLSEQRKK